MRRHPAFLFGCAQTDPYKIRFGRIDLSDDVRILLRGQVTERRRHHSGNLHSRIALLDLFAKQLQCFRRGAVEIVPPAFFGTSGQYLFHEVRACHTLSRLIAVFPAVLGERPSIRECHDRIILDFAVRGIVMGGDSGVHIGHTDIFSPPLLEFCLDQVQGLFHIGDHDMDPHDVTGVHQGNINQVDSVDDADLCCIFYEIVVDRHHRYPDMVGIRNGDQFLQIVAFLGFLRNNHMIHTGFLKDFMKLQRGSQIVRHIFCRSIGEVPHIPHGSRVPGNHILVKPVCHGAIAHNHNPCCNIMFQHIPRGSLVKYKALDDNGHNRQGIEQNQKQTGKLRQLKNEKDRCHQGKPDQVRHKNLDQFTLDAADVQRLIAALGPVAHHHDRCIQYGQRHEPIHIVH